MSNKLLTGLCTKKEMTGKQLKDIYNTSGRESKYQAIHGALKNQGVRRLKINSYA